MNEHIAEHYKRQIVKDKPNVNLTIDDYIDRIKNYTIKYKSKSRNTQSFHSEEIQFIKS